MLAGKKDNAGRKYRGIGGSRNNPIKVMARRKRASEHQSRSPAEQLAHLDKMGYTAKKERAKLAAKLASK